MTIMFHFSSQCRNMTSCIWTGETLQTAHKKKKIIQIYFPSFLSQNDCLLFGFLQAKIHFNTVWLVQTPVKSSSSSLVPQFLELGSRTRTANCTPVLISQISTILCITTLPENVPRSDKLRYDYDYICTDLYSYPTTKSLGIAFISFFFVFPIFIRWKENSVFSHRRCEKTKSFPIFVSITV